MIDVVSTCTDAGGASRADNLPGMQITNLALSLSGADQELKVGTLTVKFQRGLLLRGTIALFGNPSDKPGGMTTITGEILLSTSKVSGSLIAAGPIAFLDGALVLYKDTKRYPSEGPCMELLIEWSPAFRFKVEVKV